MTLFPPIWREREDGYKLTLVLADAGFKALVLARKEHAAEKAEPKPTTKTANKQINKQERLVAMLRSSKGATIDELCHDLGWQPHSARAIISVTVRCKLIGTCLSRVTLQAGSPLLEINAEALKS